jgi:hypothetical protein
MRPVDIRLVPEPGRRRAAVTFTFDLPSGNYTATGGFQPTD